MEKLHGEGNAAAKIDEFLNSAEGHAWATEHLYPFFKGIYTDTSHSDTTTSGPPLWGVPGQAVFVSIRLVSI